MADSSGFEYLSLVQKTLGQKLDICLHPIPNHLSWVLDRENSDNQYSNFGESKFFRLMHLKWEIIFQAASEIGGSDFVVFTDLDVIWKKRPINPFPTNDGVEKHFAIQKDFSPHGRKFYCPGIMFWKRDSLSLEILRNIQAFHRSLMEKENIPDDKAINIWLEDKDNFSKMVALSEYDYVIGHRILYLLAGVRNFSLGRFTAFHANYVSGLEKKLKIMEYALLTPRYISRRFQALSQLLIDRMKNRLFRN